MAFPAPIEALRPHQWVKNLLVFAPLLFARRLTDQTAILHAVLAFVGFCAAASAIYLFNDLLDREADARHPKKRRRPIASGRLRPGTARIEAVLLVLTTLGIGLTIPPDHAGVPFLTWPLAYLILNVAYTLRLKRVAIVDAICIALGFQLRVHTGSAAIGVPSSGWLLLCTFFFATFVALCKRRAELAGLEVEGTDKTATRRSLRDYDVAFLDQIVAPVAAMSVLAYALYTLDAATIHKHGPHLGLTVPVVTFGVFRYLWLVLQRDGAEDPARLLFRDRQLLIAGVVWVALVTALILGTAPRAG